MGNFGHAVFLGCYLEFKSIEDKESICSVEKIIFSAEIGNSFARRVTSYKTDIEDGFWEIIYGDTNNRNDLQMVEYGEEYPNKYWLLTQTNVAKNMNHSEVIQVFDVVPHGNGLEEVIKSELYADFISFAKSVVDVELKYGLVMVYQEVM